MSFETARRTTRRRESTSQGYAGHSSTCTQQACASLASKTQHVASTWTRLHTSENKMMDENEAIRFREAARRVKAALNDFLLSSDSQVVGRMENLKTQMNSLEAVVDEIRPDTGE